jgi:phage repressor protein C with HTH and peptisase S24 domain
MTRQPVLHAADIFFQESEFAGMVVVPMRGDSMGDTIRIGDFAVIDTAQTDVGRAGVFAFLENGSVVIAQVQRVREDGRSTGRIECTPRNPRYMPFVLPLEDVRIIGRVVHKITRHL